MHFFKNFLLWCMMNFFASHSGRILFCLVFILTPASKNTHPWKAPKSERARLQIAIKHTGENLYSFAETDSWNHFRGLAWMDLPWMVCKYFLKSSLLALEEVSFRNCVHPTGCSIHKVKFLLSLSKVLLSFSCTGVSTITLLSESNYCAESSWWCSWLEELASDASVAHASGDRFWAIFIQIYKTCPTT